MTKDKKPPETSRRGFLKLSAAAGAGALPLGSAAAQAQAGELPPLLPVPEKPGFDHLVVLMFENRSFDNLLGYLYPPEKLPAGQTFDGIPNGNYANPSPGRSDFGAHLHRTDRHDHGQPEPGSGRGISARQHAAVRHRRSARQRACELHRHVGALQRAAGRREGRDAGFRHRLHQQFRRDPGQAADERKSSPSSWARSAPR